MKTLKKKCQAKKIYEYEHVLKVWEKFEMKMMKYYHDLYLKCDVSLFADVFEEYENKNLKNYGLCPSYYLSAPSLSWHAMLKIAKIELELIPDPEMYIYSLRKVQEVEFLIFLIDIAKITINI